MALRTTPTIAICLTAGIAAGIALSRPGDEPAPATTAADTPAAEVTPDTGYGAPAAEPTPEESASAAAEPLAISIENFAFSGATTGAPGSTVTVTNLDGAAHTVTAQDGSFNTGSLDQNGSIDIVLPTEPGTYAYFCAFHPSMTGELTVG